LPLRPFTDNPRELQLGEFILDLGKDNRIYDEVWTAVKSR
jgi:spermidine/putrescine transport system substrate-binding protein